MQRQVKSTVERPTPLEPMSELQTLGVVKRSDSGQLSVSIGDVSKTESFKRDLETLGRIRRLAKVNSVRR